MVVMARDADRRPPASLLLVPFTVATLIAQQVASNAIRDGLFLTWFPVTTLPYFITASAILAVPAAESSGRLLALFGPGRVVPVILGVNAVWFLTEWTLLGDLPRGATVLVYLHASVRDQPADCCGVAGGRGRSG
jgi:hypothetical protein